MLTPDDIARFLHPLKIKMQSMIGRAVLLAVDDSGKTQRMRVQLSGDELIEAVERLQEYGLETNPPIDDTAEVVVESIGGVRELSVITKTQVRAFRPAKLPTGEVCLFSKFGQTIILKTDGSVLVKPKAGQDVNLYDAGGNTVVVDTVIDKFNNHTHDYMDLSDAGDTKRTSLKSNTQLAINTDTAAHVKAKV